VFFRHILTYQASTVSQNQKLEVIVQCLTWLVQFLGKKPIFTSKVWHIHPTSSPCCTTRIATKLFPVHCHIINMKTLKYHFPTVCTWGVMQLLVNPIWSTILGLSPTQRRVNLKRGKFLELKTIEGGYRRLGTKLVEADYDCLGIYWRRNSFKLRLCWSTY